MSNVDFRGVDAFLRKVAYEFQIDSEVFSAVLPTRLDIGSPISFIKQKYVNPNVIKEIDEREYECEYSGINDSKLKIFGSVKVKATIGRINRDVSLFVVDDNTMKLPVILGRDSFEKFGFKLVESDKCISESVQDILNIDVDAINALETECPKINGEVSVQDQQKLKTLFLEEYVIPERPGKPQVEAELKISLKEHKPYQFGPRRLSYSEKDDLRSILDRLIDLKCIKPSESEYAPPIVLVKRKMVKRACA